MTTKPLKPSKRRAGRKIGHCCIYTLSDADGVVRYVGQTVDSIRRAWLHGNRSNNRGTRPVNHWARKLIDAGRRPVLTVVEITDALDERERFWIAHYRTAGANLLNLTDGGQLSGTQIAQHSRQTKGRKKDALHHRMMGLAMGIRWLTSRGDDAGVAKMRHAIARSEDKLNRLTKECGGNRAEARLIFSALIEERQRCRAA